MRRRTLTLLCASVDTRASNEDIVNNCEATLAIHPTAINRQDACIMQNSGLIESHTSTMDRTGKWNLVGVEKVKA